MSFSRRLTLVYGTALLTTAACVSGVTGWVATASANRMASEHQEQLSRQLGDLLDQRMWARQNEIRLLAAAAPLADPSRRAEAAALIRELQTVIGVFTWIGITDAKGTVQLATNGILTGQSIANRPVFHQGIRSSYVGDVHNALLLANHFPRQANGEPVQFVDIAEPIRNSDGRAIGVLASHLSWEWARYTSQSLIQPLSTQRGVELFVLSQNGTKLLGPPSVPTGTAIPDLHLSNLKAGQHQTRLLRWPDGQRYLTTTFRTGGYQNYPGLRWVTLVRQPQALAEAPGRQVAHVVLIATVLIGAVAIGAAVALSHWVNHPLRRLSQLGRALASGANLDAALGSPEAAPPPSNELSSLHSSICRLRDYADHQHAARQPAEAAARHDPLTGLLNRQGLADALQRLAERDADADAATVIAVLAVDLDGFKAVNDHFGHASGDVVLEVIAERIRVTAGSDCPVTRLGGDEFLLLLPCTGEQAEPLGRALGERLIRLLSEPVALGPKTVQVSASVGLAIWPLDADDLPVVTRLADQALGLAKKTGKHRLVRWQAQQHPDAP